MPSIVFGLWGIFVLAPWLDPGGDASSTTTSAGSSCSHDGNVSLAGGGTIFTAGIVLAVMILPIITSVTREVFALTPRGHVEAAQALGATKWEVIRMTVFPYGRSGMIAASMLGLGRALGETIAILIILRTAAQAGTWSLFDGGYTFASKIASAAAEFSAPLPTGAYIAAGFVLFALTFVVNALARLRPAEGLAEDDGQHSTQPVKAPTFHPIGASRKLKNNIATTLFTASFVVAMIPLVWLLYTVLAQGHHRDHLLDVVEPLACRRAAGAVRRRCVPRDLRHARSRPSIAAVLSVPLGVMAAVYLVEYGQRPIRQGDDVHGRHPRRCAVDRGRAVHLRAVDCDAWVPNRAPSRFRWPWCC